MDKKSLFVPDLFLIFTLDPMPYYLELQNYIAAMLGMVVIELIKTNK